MQDKEEDLWERDFKKVAIRYLSNNFLFDFLSVVPFLIGKLIAGSEPPEIYMERTHMQVFAYLRLLRITQLPKILNASAIYA